MASLFAGSPFPSTQQAVGMVIKRWLDSYQRVQASGLLLNSERTMFISTSLLSILLTYSETKQMLCMKLSTT